jgi:hypothetical protein
MTTKASGMPVPGKLTDYLVEETSLVDYPANDRPFLVRKNAGQFTPQQIEELKANGIEPGEAPSLFKQLRSALMSDIQDLFKKLMAPMATQKGTDPMSEQAASEATENKVLTDEDLAKVQALIDAALQPWEEKFSAFESRVAALEAPKAEEVEDKAPMEDKAPEVSKEAPVAPATDATAEQIKALASSTAELQAMVKSILNQRPAGQVEKGSPAAPETQKKAVFSGSVFEKIAEMA